MAKQRDKQFKLDVVKYRKENPELSTEQCSKNLGIGHSTLCKWVQEFQTTGEIKVVGSGKYQSEVEKEKYQVP